MRILMSDAPVKRLFVRGDAGPGRWRRWTDMLYGLLEVYGFDVAVVFAYITMYAAVRREGYGR